MKKVLILVFLLAVLAAFAMLVGAAEIGTCQTISSSGVYTLNTSINYTSGNCFNVTTSHVLLEGGNSTVISGGGTGTGINVTGATNITIRNFAGLNNWTEAVNFTDVNDSFIFNVTIDSDNASAATGFFLVDSFNNLINYSTVWASNNSVVLLRANSTNLTHNFFNTTLFDGVVVGLTDTSLTLIYNNTVDAANGTSSSGIGIVNGGFNNVTLNNVTTRGTQSSGVALQTSTDNVVDSNTVITDGDTLGAIYLLTGASRNNISSNTILTASESTFAVWLVGASDFNRIEGNNIDAADAGFKVDNALHSVIQNNVMNTSKTTAGANAVDIDESNSTTLYGNSMYVSDNVTDTSNGVLVRVSSGGNNISSNLIMLWGTEGTGIIVTSASNNTVELNNVTTFGNDSNVLSVTSSASNNYFFSNILNTSGNDTYAIYIAASDNNFTGNTVEASGNNSWGITLDSGSSPSLLLNNVVDTVNDTGHGIYFNSNTNNVTNNTVKTTGQGSHGMYLSHYNTIVSNTVKTTGGASPYPIVSSGGDGNIIERNTAVAEQTRGIYLTGGANDNNISYNFVDTNTSAALTAEASHNNTFISNHANSGDDYGLQISSSAGNNTFLNNNLSGSYGLFDGVDDNNTLLYNNTYGYMNWSKSNLTARLNLSIGTTIILQQNLVGLESHTEDNESINASAAIEIRNLTYSGLPILLRDGVRCDNETNRLQCNITYDSSTGVLDANVTSFSNYSTQEVSVLVSFNTPPADEALSDLNTSIVINVTVANETGVADIDAVLFQLSNGSSADFNITASNTNGTEWNATLTLASLEDGSHNITVFANDTRGNINRTEIRTISYDSAAPTISAISASEVTSSSAKISVTSSEAATCKLDTEDVGYGNMGTEMTGSGTATHTKSVSSLSSSTTYVYYVRCQDIYNHAATSSSSVSFTTASSGGGGSGGSSGGSSSGSAGEFEKKTWTSIFAGETATVEVDNGAIGVTEVSFSVDEDAYGLWVKIDKEESFPSTVPAFSGEVYRKLEITKNSGTKVDLQDIVVEFKVAEEWLSSKGFGNGDVALFRHVDGEWVELETEQTGEKDGYVHYASSTPGFSYFVIGEKTSAAVADTPETSDSAAEQPDKDSEEVEGVQEGLADALASTSGGAPNWVWIVVAVIVVAGIIIWFFNNRKK